MAKEIKKEKIDNNEYLFTQLDPRKSAKLMLWLLGLVGSPIGKAIGGFKSGKNGKGLLDAELDFDAVGAALQALFEKADDQKVEENIDLLLDTVLHEGKPLSLDSIVFQGKVLHMFKVVRRALEVNYSDFLAVSRGVSAAMGKMMTMMSEKQTSTGSSGDQSLPASQP